jgi:hypothetical protein
MQDSSNSLSSLLDLAKIRPFVQAHHDELSQGMRWGSLTKNKLASKVGLFRGSNEHPLCGPRTP